MEIIREEKLKEPETRKFLENAFRDGEIKTIGTDIDKLMPPISRFGGGGRAKKKQSVIDKLKTFFERFFGIGPAKFTQDKPGISYYTPEPDMKYMMAADGTGSYGNDANRNGGE